MSLSAQILNYINALKWPVVVAGGVYYFRKPFAHILERISMAQRGAISGPVGTGISWDNTLKEVDAAVDDAKAELSEQVVIEGDKGQLPPIEGLWGFRWSDDPGVRQWESVEVLLAVAPPAAVVMAFTAVEGALREVARQQGVDRTERMGVTQLARATQLPDEIRQALRQLAELRNAVIHQNANPDEADAREYAHSAEGVFHYIRLYGGLVGEMKPGDQDAKE